MYHPISLLTQCNINYILCHADKDPFYLVFGDYYLYFVDHYLNLASFLVAILVFIQSMILRMVLNKIGIVKMNKSDKLKKIE